MSLLARLFPPPPMPEPDPKCRVYDFAQTVELLRNRDRYVAQSAAQRNPIPRPAVATDSPSPNGAAAAGNLSTTRSKP